MSKPLSGTKIAFLASNGFNEQDLTSLQRALMQAGSPLKIVSPDTGLINGWTGTGFGHHYAIDAALSTALGVDYDMLVIAGGGRSLDKLALTAHSKRFIGSILSLGRPVVAFGDAVRLLADISLLSGRSVSAPAFVRNAVESVGAVVSPEWMTFDGNLASINCETVEQRTLAVSSVVDFFVSHGRMAQAA